MLYNRRIEVSEGIGINKTSASKEYIICYKIKSLVFNQLFVMVFMIC